MEVDDLTEGTGFYFGGSMTAKDNKGSFIVAAVLGTDSSSLYLELSNLVSFSFYLHLFPSTVLQKIVDLLSEGFEDDRRYHDTKNPVATDLARPDPAARPSGGRPSVFYGLHGDK